LQKEGRQAVMKKSVQYTSESFTGKRVTAEGCN